MPPKKLTEAELEEAFNNWKTSGDGQWDALEALKKALAENKEMGKETKDCGPDMLMDINSDWSGVLAALTRVVDAFKVTRKQKT
jgi:hypothetical protein